ncbi:MAG: hypothetical protein KH452_04555 [Clostridiales bacterium]|nr:hypothetical protein [Clostridiales bacterium]
MKRTWKTKGAFALAGILMLGSGLTVCAEEVTPAGYHVYDVQEDQAQDTWYGISRGSYLKSGTAKLKKDDSTHAICTGNTLAQKSCDRVYVRIYLDQSDTGTGGWGTIDYWTGITNEDSVATASSGSYRVTKNKYYSVTGVHTVTEGDKVESTTTYSDALLFN